MTISIQANVDYLLSTARGAGMTTVKGLDQFESAPLEGEEGGPKEFIRSVAEYYYDEFIK
jgi:hypothetical protein